MTLVLFLLCSGFFPFTFALNHLRVFRLPGIKGEWGKALKKCNKTGESFVTLYDEEDAKFIANFKANFSALFGQQAQTVWLGLHRNQTQMTWSDGSKVTFNISFEGATNGKQICVAIDNRTWTSFNCSERKPFMCYKDNVYTLIEDEKNWCQALQHCRTKYFGDLVSISNKTQNDTVIGKGNNKSFWIGFMHDEWEWTDNSCSTFREWGDDKSPDAHEFNYTIHQSDEPVLHKNPYSNEAFSFCSEGTARIKVIDEKFTWEEAFDYCKAHHTGLLWIEDQDDQKAVEQWLNFSNVTGLFWIGLRQSRVFGFWIWTSDMTVSGFQNWNNDRTPEMPLSNNCGAIKNTGKWSDVNCWVHLPFLCEEEIVYMNKK